MRSENTLLPRFFGLIRITTASRRRIRLVIFNNLLPDHVPIHEKYDLKGSTLGRWATFIVPPFSHQIDLWTAESVTGNWSRAPAIYSLPPPFDGRTAGESWLCYAAKTHLELLAAAPPRTGVGEFALSYICNAQGDQAAQRQLFQRGGMALSRRGYWPRFHRARA